MSIPVRRRSEAERELVAYVDAIAEENPDAALRLIDAFESPCRLLANQPEMGRRYQTDDLRLRELDLRRWVLPDFPNYLVFYRFDGNSIEIIHVMHAKLATSDNSDDPPRRKSRAAALGSKGWQSPVSDATRGG